MGWYARRRGPWFQMRYASTVQLLPAQPPECATPDIECSQNFLALFRRAISWTTPSAGLLYLGHGHVFSRDGVVMSSRSELFDEFSHGWANDLRFKKPYHRPFQLFTLDYREIFEPATVLALPGFDSHYHFLLQAVVRLHLLGEAFSLIRHFIVPDTITSQQVEWLEAAGVPCERLYRIGARTKLSCHQLFVASIPHVEGAISGWVIEALSKIFRVPASIQSNRKIYLARSAAAKRPVVNEAEVRECVVKRGYHVFDGHMISPREQVDVMAEASVIVSAHGAALTNMVFARPCKVLEIFNRYRADVISYYPLAQKCGHRYFWLPAEGTGSGPLDGISVNIPDLDRALNLIEA